MIEESRLLSLYAVCAWALADTHAAQTFTNVTNPVGLGGYIATTGDDHGPGAACGDYDGDGWVDIYLVEAGGGGGHLYRNIEDAAAPGGRSFERDLIAGAWDPLPSTGAVFVDIDNDGDQDLYIANFDARNTLLRNELIPTGNATFVDITEATDPTPDDPPGDLQEGVGIGYDSDGIVLRKSLAVCFADIDRDGLVDLFVGNHNGFAGDGATTPGERDILYRQQLDGTFLDVSSSAGVPGWEFDLGGYHTFYQRYSSCNAAIFCDLNNDRWPDLYVTNKAGSRVDRDSIYLNRGRDLNGVWQGFESVAAKLNIGGVSNAAMGVDVADVDKDGDFDVYITDASSEIPGSNDMWRNDLTENGGPFGMSLRQQAPASFSWGTWFGDVDNDGDSDLHVATESGLADHLYINDNGVFTEVSNNAGVQQALDSRGDVWLDYDQDGWLDFLVINIFSPVSLFRNTTGDSNPGNWLVLELEGTDPTTTRDALGTRVEVRGDFDGDGVLEDNEFDLRELTRGGSNCAASHEGIVHFGVGSANRVALSIHWPHGGTQIFNSLSVNKRMQFMEPSGVADTQPPTVEILQPLAATIATEPGPLSLEVHSVDDRAVTEVRYFVDETFVGRDVTPDGTVFRFDLRLDRMEPGPHDVRVEASDAFGNLASSSSSFVLDAQTPSSLHLEPDHYGDAFATAGGDAYPAGITFSDGCRDFTLEYGSDSPTRAYAMPHNASELFVDGSRASLRGRMARTVFGDRVGFGITLLPDPVSSPAPPIEYWLIIDGYLFHAGGELPGSNRSDLEPLYSIDWHTRNDEFELMLTREGAQLRMEILRVSTGLSHEVGVFDAASRGIDLDDYSRVGFCFRGEGSSETTSILGVRLSELEVTRQQIGTPCLDGFGWNARVELGDQPLAGNDDFKVMVSGVDGGAIAVLLLGPYEDVILPLGLAGFGAPGCELLVLPVTNVVRFTNGSGPGQGNASVTLPVPTSSSLIGENYGAQWVVLAPGVNPAGVVYSSAAELRIR